MIASMMPVTAGLWASSINLSAAASRADRTVKPAGADATCRTETRRQVSLAAVRWSRDLRAVMMRSEAEPEQTDAELAVEDVGSGVLVTPDE